MNRLGPAGRSGKATLIACLHLDPLPGSPAWGGSLAPIVERALREAEIFAAAGVDGMIIENTHDIPYLKRPAEAGTVAGMAVVADHVRRRFDHPLGIQVLAGANLAALDIAIACDLDFIRAEAFAYAHVADEGLLEADAGHLMRRRSHLGANHIEIWTDVKKKHASHAVTSDLSLRDVSGGAVYYGVDGVIVTGSLTGKPASLEELDSIADLPVRRIVGSGVGPGNIHDYARRADVLIVGSALKMDDDWQGDVDEKKVAELVRLLKLQRTA